MDLSIQTKDENWFLRICHYVVIGINQLAENENTVNLMFIGPCIILIVE